MLLQCQALLSSQALMGGGAKSRGGAVDIATTLQCFRKLSAAGINVPHKLWVAR
jgi:hypothetical protein